MKQNDLMNKKYKKVWTDLNCIEQSTVTGCISISAFASLIFGSVGSASSAVGLKICGIITVIKRYQSVIEKEKKYVVKC